MKAINSLILFLVLLMLSCSRPIYPKACPVPQKSQKETSSKFISGTEWEADLSSWKVERFDPPRELIATKENYKSVKLAIGSIMVLPWNECPSTFMRSAAMSFIESNQARPLKETTIEINGYLWYLFSFEIGNSMVGIFGSTANGNHGFIVECTALGDLDDQIEVCADFIASFIIVAPKTPSKPIQNPSQLNL